MSQLSRETLESDGWASDQKCSRNTGTIDRSLILLARLNWEQIDLLRRASIEARDALFGGDLPRRIERTGVMNFRHLMIREAENLPQDFVRVLAEQR
jgi:hypothetical protein